MKRRNREPHRPSTFVTRHVPERTWLRSGGHYCVSLLD